MTPFEYVIYYVPEDDEGKVLRSKARVLVEPTVVLASDDRGVTLRAAKEIPSEIDGDPVDLEFVNVVVRPF